jgi:hypothetical protein
MFKINRGEAPAERWRRRTVGNPYFGLCGLRNALSRNDALVFDRCL